MIKKFKLSTSTAAILAVTYALVSNFLYASSSEEEDRKFYFQASVSTSNATSTGNDEKCAPLSSLKHIKEGSIHLIKGAGSAVTVGVEIADNLNNPIKTILTMNDHIEQIEKATDETTLATEETTLAYDDMKESTYNPKKCNLF